MHRKLPAILLLLSLTAGFSLPGSALESTGLMTSELMKIGFIH